MYDLYRDSVGVLELTHVYHRISFKSNIYHCNRRFNVNDVTALLLKHEPWIYNTGLQKENQ